MVTNEREEKEGVGITEFVAIVGVTVSIGGWHKFAKVLGICSIVVFFPLIILIALTFSMPCVIFAKPISKKAKELKLKRKQNVIATIHFARLLARGWWRPYLT